MVGKKLNHYEIVGRLGKGGMGEVYAADDTKLGRRVALKVLPAEVGTDPEHRARLEKEARAVAALNHPNIVTIYSIEEADGVPFLTMELIDGSTLTDILKRGPLTRERFFDVALALADALSAAHPNCREKPCSRRQGRSGPNGPVRNRTLRRRRTGVI